jgi:hypothetical protein
MRVCIERFIAFVKKQVLIHSSLVALLKGLSEPCYRWSADVSVEGQDPELTIQSLMH